MTIRIIEEMDEYIINCEGREIRVEKPKDIKEVKRIAREHFDAVGEKVNWKLF